MTFRNVLCSDSNLTSSLNTLACKSLTHLRQYVTVNRAINGWGYGAKLSPVCRQIIMFNLVQLWLPSLLQVWHSVWQFLYSSSKVTGRSSRTTTRTKPCTWARVCSWVSAVPLFLYRPVGSSSARTARSIDLYRDMCKSINAIILVARGKVLGLVLVGEWLATRGVFWGWADHDRIELSIRR